MPRINTAFDKSIVMLVLALVVVVTMIVLPQTYNLAQPQL